MAGPSYVEQIRAAGRAAAAKQAPKAPAAKAPPKPPVPKVAKPVAPKPVKPKAPPKPKAAPATRGGAGGGNFSPAPRVTPSPPQPSLAKPLPALSPRKLEPGVGQSYEGQNRTLADWGVAPTIARPSPTTPRISRPPILPVVASPRPAAEPSPQERIQRFAGAVGARTPADLTYAAGAPAAEQGRLAASHSAALNTVMLARGNPAAFLGAGGTRDDLAAVLGHPSAYVAAQSKAAYAKGRQQVSKLKQDVKAEGLFAAANPDLSGGKVPSYAELYKQKLAHLGQPQPSFFGKVTGALNAPFSAAGNLISGHPGDAAENLIGRGRQSSVGQGLQDIGVLPKGTAYRAAADFLVPLVASPEVEGLAAARGAEAAHGVELAGNTTAEVAPRIASLGRRVNITASGKIARAAVGGRVSLAESLPALAQAREAARIRTAGESPMGFTVGKFGKKVDIPLVPARAAIRLRQTAPAKQLARAGQSVRENFVSRFAGPDAPLSAALSSAAHVAEGRKASEAAEIRRIMPDHGPNAMSKGQRVEAQRVAAGTATTTDPQVQAAADWWKQKRADYLSEARKAGADVPEKPNYVPVIVDRTLAPEWERSVDYGKAGKGRPGQWGPGHYANPDEAKAAGLNPEEDLAQIAHRYANAHADAMARLEVTKLAAKRGVGVPIGETEVAQSRFNARLGKRAEQAEAAGDATLAEHLRAEQGKGEQTLHEQMGSGPLGVPPAPGGEVPAGYAPLDNAFIQGVHVPAEEGATYEKFFPRGSGDPGKTSQVLTYLTRKWKAAKLATPGYDLRNLVSDVYRQIQEGVSPLSRGAVRVQRGASEAEVGKTGLTAEEASVLFRHAGVPSGQVRGEILPGASNHRRDLGMGGLPGPHPLRWYERNIRLPREDLNRFTTATNMLHRGRSPLAAAEKSRAVHFDYANPGRAVEAGRKFAVPFDTWTAKNLPRQLSLLWRRPGQAVAYANLVKGAAQLSGHGSYAHLPSWVQEQLPVPIPGLGWTTYGLPIGDLGTFVPGSTGDVKRAAQNFAGMTNPAIQAAIAAGTGKNIATGQDIKDIVPRSVLTQWWPGKGFAPVYDQYGHKKVESGVPGWLDYITKALAPAPAVNVSAAAQQGADLPHLLAGVGHTPLLTKQGQLGAAIASAAAAKAAALKTLSTQHRLAGQKGLTGQAFQSAVAPFKLAYIDKLAQWAALRQYAAGLKP